MLSKFGSTVVRSIAIVAGLVAIAWALWAASPSEPKDDAHDTPSLDRPAHSTERYAAGFAEAEARASASLPPPNAVEIVGQVEDLTGGPIEGAVVRVGPWATRTDAEGRFALAAPPGTSILDVEAEGYVPVHHEIAALGTPLRFRLVPAATIEGHVQLADGAPVAGAVVSAGQRRTTSAEDGSFRLVGLLPGRYQVTASAPGLRTRLSGSVALGLAESRSGVTVVLVPAATVVVRLSDPQGEIACRAGTLTLASDAGPVTGSVTAEGTARIDGLSPGSYLPQLGCTDPVYTWQGPLLRIDGAGTTERNLTVPWGTDVRACIPRDVPPSGTLALDDAAGTRHSADVDADGCATFRRIPPGPARVGPALLGGLDGWVEAVTTTIGSEPRTVDLPARPAGVIEGRLEGADGIMPLEVGLVTGGARAGVGRDGTFRLPGVPAGTVELEVRDAEGMRRALAGDPTVTVEAGQTAFVTLALAASDGVLEGRVLDADGGPAGDVFVTVVEADDDSFQTWLVVDRATGSTGGRTAITGPDGSFELSGVGPGPVRIVATDRRGISTRTGPVDPGTFVTVHLPAPGRIDGHVTGTSGGWTLRVHGRDVAIASRYEGEAPFEIEPLPVPGSYRIEVVADDGASVRKRIELTAAAPEASVDLEVFSPRRIRGRVVGPDGQPRPGAWIAGTLTDEHGRFEASVAVDETTILLWDRPGGGLPRRIPLPPGREDLDLGDVASVPPG